MLWDRAEKKKSPAQWGLKYLWDKKEVDIVLSGMKDIKFVKENINCASESGVNCLNEKERLLIQEVKETYLEKIEVGCTDCKYCMPCPFGVNIPRALRALNDAKMFGDINTSKKAYFDSVKIGNRADKCVNCKECLEKCPQKINIPKELEKLVELL
jgi:predicted aldo/keto reductase-like oxidoreductase